MSVKLGATRAAQPAPIMYFSVTCGVCVAVCLVDQHLFGESNAGRNQVFAFTTCAIVAYSWLRRKGAAAQRPPPKAVRRLPPRDQRVDADLLEGILAACHSGNLALADERFSSAVNSLDGEVSINVSVDTGNSDPGGPAHGKAGDGGSGLPGYMQAQLLVEACMQAGDTQLAAAWFEQLCAVGLRPGTKTLLAVLTPLAEKGLMRKAEEVFVRALAAGARADMACYHLMFDRCTPPGDKRAVEFRLRRLMGRSQYEQTLGFVALLRSKVQTQDGRQVEDWMARAADLGVPLGGELYSAVVHALVRTGDTDRAERWLERMEAAARSAPWRPHVATYSAIMDSHIKRGETRRAEACFERMVAAGINPDAVTFCTILKAYTREGSSLAGAERWLSLAREQGVRLGAFSYSVVIALAARALKPERAEWWLHRMLQDGLEADVVSYNVIINASARKDDASCAQRLVALMCKRGVEPNVVTLGAAMKACAKAGDLTRAEAMFEQIISRGKLEPNAIVYNTLINAAVQAGDMARAESWLATMLESGVPPSAVSYNTLLHVYARAGNITKAEHGLERMLAHGIEADVSSYTAVITACSKIGEVLRAEKWFSHMRGAGIQPNAASFAALLNACAKAHDYNRAEKWLEQMHEEGVPPKVFCYTPVIEACARAGCAERAERWLRCLMGEKGCPEHKAGQRPELAPTIHCYTAAAQAYAAQGAFGDVERLFAEMEKRGLTMNEFSLTVLLSAYSRAKPCQSERAERAFRAYASRGLPVTKPPLRLLRIAVGSQRFLQMLNENPWRGMTKEAQDSVAECIPWSDGV